MSASLVVGDGIICARYVAKETPMSDRAIAPRGINHLVLNVRDLEVSHRFWT
jgi:hypothetical protein